MIDPDYLRPRLLHRENDSHKGDYGHLVIIAGCETMPGAAVLATGAALQSGCGLVTLHSTERTLQAAAVNFPSAILSEDPGTCFSCCPMEMDRYSAIVVGPGLGKAEATIPAFRILMDIAGRKSIPMVLDADALNIIADHPEYVSGIPRGSILTPHLGEFRRLFPLASLSDMDDIALDFSRRSGDVLVLKGFHSKVFTPGGDVLVNTTGNPGMAKGGSGDVLSGLIGGLLARGYPSEDAAALGVWIHGYAGDVLTAGRTAESYSSRDLIDNLWQGFHRLYT